MSISYEAGDVFSTNSIVTSLAGSVTGGGTSSSVFVAFVTVGSMNQYVTSISQTNVTWSFLCKYQPINQYGQECWIGYSSGTPSSSVIVNISALGTIQVAIYRFSGIAASSALENYYTGTSSTTTVTVTGTYVANAGDVEFFFTYGTPWGSSVFTPVFSNALDPADNSRTASSVSERITTQTYSNQTLSQTCGVNHHPNWAMVVVLKAIGSVSAICPITGAQAASATTAPTGVGVDRGVNVALSGLQTTSAIAGVVGHGGTYTVATMLGASCWPSNTALTVRLGVRAFPSGAQSISRVAATVNNLTVVLTGKALVLGKTAPTAAGGTNTAATLAGLGAAVDASAPTVVASTNTAATMAGLAASVDTSAPTAVGTTSVNAAAVGAAAAVDCSAPLALGTAPIYATGILAGSNTALGTAVVLESVTPGGTFLAYGFAMGRSKATAHPVAIFRARGRAVAWSFASAAPTRMVYATGRMAGSNAAFATQRAVLAAAALAGTTAASASASVVYSASGEASGTNDASAVGSGAQIGEIRVAHTNTFLGVPSGVTTARGTARSRSFARATAACNTILATGTLWGSSSASYTDHPPILAEANPLFGYTAVRARAAATLHATGTIWCRSWAFGAGRLSTPVAGIAVCGSDAMAAPTVIRVATGRALSRNKLVGRAVT